MGLRKLIVNNLHMQLFAKQNEEYFSLSDIAESKDTERTDYIIQNWIRNRNTIEFIGLWEKLHNPIFNSIEFERFKNRAGYLSINSRKLQT